MTFLAIETQIHFLAAFLKLFLVYLLSTLAG
jgi:hypothetical protein